MFALAVTQTVTTVSLAGLGSRPLLKGSVVMSLSAIEIIQAAYPGKIFLDTNDLAKILSITPASIRTMRSQGRLQIKSARPGRFDIRDVADYLDSQRQPQKRRGPKTKVQRLAEGR